MIFPYFIIFSFLNEINEQILSNFYFDRNILFFFLIS